ncbi:hypothetical protein [Mycobacterium sp.]|uniref:hypothetical protein n=1 Tax=Mycobacterium sp. TaxID=1785 RepID=UPI003D09C256
MIEDRSGRRADYLGRLLDHIPGRAAALAPRRVDWGASPFAGDRSAEADEAELVFASAVSRRPLQGPATQRFGDALPPGRAVAPVSVPGPAGSAGAARPGVPVAPARTTSVKDVRAAEPPPVAPPASSAPAGQRPTTLRSPADAQPSPVGGPVPSVVGLPQATAEAPVTATDPGFEEPEAKTRSDYRGVVSVAAPRPQPAAVRVPVESVESAPVPVGPMVSIGAIEVTLTPPVAPAPVRPEAPMLSVPAAPAGRLSRPLTRYGFGQV